jgi:purine-cytosine permease-like protein
MSEYRDVQSAVRVEKFRIWFAWVCGNVIMLIIANGTRNVDVLSTVTQVLCVVVFLLLTFAAVTMTNRLNRKAAAARREVLGDDA